jgi:predicted DNA-binding transcriptional regulator AlpA
MPHKRGSNTETPMGEQLLKTIDVARATGLASVTLRRWRTSGVGPRFVRLGRAVRYRPSDLAAFVEERAARSTTEADLLAQEAISE